MPYDTPERDDYGLDMPVPPSRRPRKKPAPQPVEETASEPVSEAAAQRKKSPEQRVKPPKGPSSFVMFFRDPRKKFATGLILLALALVMGLCTLSYARNGLLDQALVQLSPEKFGMQSETIETTGGYFGARLAHFLLVDTLGLASLVIAAWFAILGVRLCHGDRLRFWALAFKSLFAAIAISIVLGLFTYNLEGMFHYGGNHGYYVNWLLMKYSDAFGAYAVSVVLTGLLFCVFYFPVRNILRMALASWRKIFPERTKAQTDTSKVDTQPAVTTLDEILREEPPAAEEPAPAPQTEQPQQETVQERTYTVTSLDMFGEEKPHRDTSEIVINIDEPEDEPEDYTADKPEDRQFEEQPENIEKQPVPQSSTQPSGGETEFVIKNSPDNPSGPVEAANPHFIPDGAVVTVDQPYDHRADLSRYVFPPLSLLIERQSNVVINEAEQQENKDLIVNALASYKIPITRIEATIGPTVTLYEIVPDTGVRIAQIKRLEDDIAMNLSALGIRIIAPIPGKGTVGIEVPNRKPQTVSIRSVLESDAFTKSKAILPMALGATISNNIFVADLAKMPHLLVAGATGQGKSVGLNCIIASLLYSKHPSELKFVLVDPKSVEFTLYRRLVRHYLAKMPEEENPIVTDPAKSVTVLNSLCIEMDQRYELLSKAEVRNIEEYNAKFSRRVLSPREGHKYMPYIVVIVDEFADLVMTTQKEVYQPIARIAQKARAVGIHMILATQRPSTDVITGMIKNNFPGRIAFRVFSGVDSKTILDRPGANRLIGRGDMLFSHNNVIERVQCAYIDTEEVEAVAKHIGDQTGYPEAFILPEVPSGDEAPTGGVEMGRLDQQFREIAMFVASSSEISITMLQRNFAIGFNKAGRIMDQLYNMGIVGPPNGAKPRQVLKGPQEVGDILGNI